MPIILFIDEIHTIIKAGDSEGAMSAANILKPYLSKLEITIIGATTNLEYEFTIKNDLAIKRRLSPIFIKNLEEETVVKILNEFSSGKLSVGLLSYIYQKSLTIKDSNNPDISIEILDRCLARKKVTGQTITKTMIDSIVRYLDES
jgi:ATP-dependent Clp protease ATP-binding subunit ClpA